jgi:hypothetical protein
MDTSNAQANQAEGCGPMAQATEQHKWLLQIVGDWTMSGTMSMPDGSTMESTGTEKVEALGELWVIGTMRSTMPGDGGEADSRLTIGYNSAKGSFEGNFVASMMDFQWIYSSGELVGNTLTLNCVGPNMMPGAEPGSTTNYRDVVEVVDNSTRYLRSFAEGPDGQWHQFMEAKYTRVG